MIVFGAFESTYIHGSGKDVLETTRHLERWRHDLDLLLSAGIRHLRYPIPWHRIERTRGAYDFTCIDGPMDYMRRQGMRPVVDPLHHTSFPEWLTGGFVHPEFSAFYCAFLRKMMERYPWIDQCTVFNEPLATTILCGLMGIWYPFHGSDHSFCRMAVQVSKIMVDASRLVRSLQPRMEFIRIDTGEYHHARDKKVESWVEFCNERRFLYDDLTAGSLDSHHPLFPYLISHGIPPDEIRWFGDHPAVPMNVCGLDYYAHSELDWRWSSRLKKPILLWPVSAPRGFASVARDYSQRYRKPLMLSETNIRGTVTDRIVWLKYMVSECATLIDEGIDLRGFCWFPSIDSTDWDKFCTSCKLSVDPQGIWWLDRKRWTRHGSELSDLYANLAAGRFDPDSVTDYPLRPPLNRDLAGYRLERGRPLLAAG